MSNAHSALKDANVGIYSLSSESTSPMPAIEFSLHEFRDPMNNKLFKGNKLCGEDEAVQEWIKEDPRLPAILSMTRLLVHDVVIAQKEPWISIGFRDHHGKWISRAVAEIVAKDLESEGYKINVIHSELCPSSR